MQQIEYRPSGRRKYTRDMVAARASRPANWEEDRRGHVLFALKSAASALGVPRRVVDLIDYLVGRTQAQDWQEGAKPLAWPPNTALEDYLQLGRSQVKYLIRTARELGLIELEERGNGNRWGYRDAAGRIVDACGFDLSPLAARHEEFRSIAAAHYERRAEGKRMRGRITGLRNEILSLADLAEEQGAAGDWRKVREEAHGISAMRGNSFDPGDLAHIVAQLDELLQGLNDVLQGMMADEIDPKGSENRPPITSTNPSKISNESNVDADGPKRPEVLVWEETVRRPSPRSGTAQQSRERSTGERKGVGPGSVLRGFMVSPDFLVRIAPPFAAWVKPGQQVTWGDLIVVVESVRKHLGVSPDAWRQAVNTFGTQDAITVLAVIAAKYAAHQVSTAGGLLRRMVELHLAGELRLDKTLFGLADGVGEPRH